MLKLTLRQTIRLWLWQRRRSVVITLASMLAALLTLGYNHLLSTDASLLSLLTLAQLGAATLLVIVVIILSD
ncbi:hypothetical protein ORJ04_11545 [Rheinheimera baltica]|uniref:Uncharacterized protein n=1 Tax=Rheinheimera baltica TaxID=67576 RepID=A0ABT9HZM3_9GAMM|nr:hypothetical protein [Rheinheimera baltica]MDP5136579.1 hypothetical protein [Rheinheimera baltica]MDP5144108.1 hypothetical protein [Rheinheimera baltica]MDP5148928.1 hypothetical protein [Rheinheimera baltica]